MVVIGNSKCKICETAFDMDIAGFWRHEIPEISWRRIMPQESGNANITTY